MNKENIEARIEHYIRTLSERLIQARKAGISRQQTSNEITKELYKQAMPKEKIEEARLLLETALDAAYGPEDEEQQKEKEDTLQ